MDWLQIYDLLIGLTMGVICYNTDGSKKKNIIVTLISCLIIILINMGIWYFRLLGWL